MKLGQIGANEKQNHDFLMILVSAWISQLLQLLQKRSILKVIYIVKFKRYSLFKNPI